jgi:hypothetical protein
MTRPTISAFMAGCLLGGLLVAGSPVQDRSESAPGAGGTLAEARENLRISELTFERIQKRLEALREEQIVDPSVLEDYSIYLEKVRAMTEGHRTIVKEFEALSGGMAPLPPVTDWRPVDDRFFDPPIPEPVDELALLERQLDQDLAAFDAFLLKEQYEAARRMEQIDEASSNEMTALAREAAAAVERLRNKGIEIDTKAPPDGGKGENEDAAGGQPGAAGGAQGASGGADGERPSGDSGAAGGQPGDAGGAQGASGGADGEPPGGDSGGAETAGGKAGEPGTGEPGDADAGDAGDAADSKGAGTYGAAGGPGQAGEGDASGSGASAAGSGGPSTPTPSGPSGPEGDGAGDPPPQGDRPPADDDDIVARQLREAAEKETDPVLKEKLWREYDKYKGSS